MSQSKMQEERSLRATLVLSGVLLLATATHSSASIIYQGSSDLGTSGNGVSTYGGQYTVSAASNLLVVLVDNFNGDSTTFGVTDNGVPMTLGCSSVASNSAGLVYSYYLLNPPTGQHNITVTPNAPAWMSVGAADYSGVGGFESCKLTKTTSPTTSTLNTQVANDWVMLATSGYTQHSAGAGDVRRTLDSRSGYYEWGMFDGGGDLAVGTHSFTTSLSTGNSINQLAMVFSPILAVASVAGTPFALGWKSADPNEQVLFTAPHTYTVSGIAMRVTAPASGVALLDVYKAANGTPCAGGTKLHTGDFNAAGAANTTQVLPLVSGATSLAVNDSVCIVTQQPFSSYGQATVTVTAN